MIAKAAFSSCENFVRGADPNRHMSAVFAPAPLRPYLFALYAFHNEIAKTAETVSQPVLGQIRLQWWRDTIGDLYEGRIRQHDVVVALAETIETHRLPHAFFDAMIDARDHDIESEPFADMAALIGYAEASVGIGMKLALRILGAGEAHDAAARDAGIAYGLTGALRAFPFWASRNRMMLPVDRVQALATGADDIMSGRMSAGLRMVILEIATSARNHLQAARKARVPGRFVSAILPAALAAPYLRGMERHDFDPFRDDTEIAIHHRQWTMLTAYLRRRL